ncbi:MAG: hypothetical protein ABR497_03425 [Kiritimatiellia bacterium]|nr:hypothetical protein [Lentisphaerota bacterium]
MQSRECNFTINRVVHLARCDIFFEMSAARASECLKTEEETRSRHADVAIGFLQSALEHAVMASKAACASPQEKSFVCFLQLVLCYLRSASALMENERELKNVGSQLWLFLNRNSAQEEVRGFSRSSEQLLQDVVHLFEMAREPLKDLRDALKEGLAPDDLARYNMAQDALRTQCAKHEASCRIQSRPNFLFNS